jgi:hypothetical protein
MNIFFNVYRERPDPKGLSTFSQCTWFPPDRGFELMSSRSRVNSVVSFIYIF